VAPLILFLPPECAAVTDSQATRSYQNSMRHHGYRSVAPSLCHRPYSNRWRRSSSSATFRS